MLCGIAGQRLLGGALPVRRPSLQRTAVFGDNWPRSTAYNKSDPGIGRPDRLICLSTFDGFGRTRRKVSLGSAVRRGARVDGEPSHTNDLNALPHAGSTIADRVHQAPMRNRRYVLIAPCRDEAEHMRRTLDSVMAQSVPPALWVVVDDGSTDETSAILESYKARMPYLRVVRRENRGRRSVGPGVIEAFYAGLETVSLDDFDYVCKLDLDLDLPPRYFELLMQRMEKNPRIGTSSGKPYFVDQGTGNLV